MLVAVHAVCHLKTYGSGGLPIPNHGIYRHKFFPQNGILWRCQLIVQCNIIN